MTKKPKFNFFEKNPGLTKERWFASTKESISLAWILNICEISTEFIYRFFDTYGADFVRWPAATKHHHNYIGGLFEHTIDMFNLAIRALDVMQSYREINHKILFTGLLVHDLGKLKEYTLDGGYNEGVKHCECGVQMFLDIAGDDFTDAEKEGVVHIIKSHHGRKEWNAVEEPATLEAEIAHSLDYLSSRLGGRTPVSDIEVEECVNLDEL